MKEKSIDVLGAHSEKLMGMIENLLDECNLSMEQVSAVAVSEGPGSYTGLRIGVSVAKGLAFAADIPLISVKTLKALSYGAKSIIEGAGLIVAMLDARRMEVYREVFDHDLDVVMKLDSEIIDENSYSELLQKGRVYFVGDAVRKVSEVIHHSNAEFLDVEISAEHVGALAYKKFVENEFADLAYFVPNYLKEFKALQSKKNPLLI